MYIIFLLYIHIKSLDNGTSNLKHYVVNMSNTKYYSNLHFRLLQIKQTAIAMDKIGVATLTITIYNVFWLITFFEGLLPEMNSTILNSCMSIVLYINQRLKKLNFMLLWPIYFFLENPWICLLFIVEFLIFYFHDQLKK